MSVRYTRLFRLGDKGTDVQGVGRALARARMLNWLVWVASPLSVKRTWGPRKQEALKKFKKSHGLIADYRYTKQAHEKLSPFFDVKARSLMESWRPPDPEKWTKLMVSMKALHNNTTGYVFGAGHGVKLSTLTPQDSYDCSSSTSKVLYDAGMFTSEYACVSGDFARNYGLPGRGQYFTVYANGGHVFIRLHKSIYWRFDTSPYGDTQSPKSGPRLRFLPRPTFGFTARHWPGM